KPADQSEGNFKYLFLGLALLITASYCWANFYVFYSIRLPGRLEIAIKEGPDWEYCLINLDKIFPESQDEMQSLLLGVENLENRPVLRGIIEKNQVISKLFRKNSHQI
ncbi:MAG: hypothetical protein PHQ23_14970, partial [Candidatus Wallbacteria bacterium]|nr:hypothetical protein [Candidatus Wallbacteria bacterium]